MVRKPRLLNLEVESQKHLEQLRCQIGERVPVSHVYTRGTRPLLLSIEADRATLRYPNGATMMNVPLRDLVDDTGYWSPTS